MNLDSRYTYLQACRDRDEARLAWLDARDRVQALERQVAALTTNAEAIVAVRYKRYFKWCLLLNAAVLALWWFG